MKGYLVVCLVTLTIAPALVFGGCAEKNSCCKGKDNKCKAYGARMNSPDAKICFCDESCLYLGDCCLDFKDVCKEQDCVMSDFGEWGQCSQNCGWGIKERKRQIIQEPRNGGKPCHNFEEKMYCYGTKCKVARHSSGHMEARETGKIIPAEFGTWRSNKFFDPFKDIRRNLFNHYSANSVIRRPAYCAKFELTNVKSSCGVSAENPWAAKAFKKGATVCVECQQLAMKKNLGVRCKGHGVYLRETRWNAVTVPGCHGKWVMKTRHEECTCNHNAESSFILI
jgi:hypothetical protein